MLNLSYAKCLTRKTYETPLSFQANYDRDVFYVESRVDSEYYCEWVFDELLNVSIVPECIEKALKVIEVPHFVFYIKFLDKNI